MKTKQRNSGLKLQLSRETVRQLISEELLEVVAGGGCPSRAGCSSATSASLNECGSVFCSLIQY